MLEKAFQIEKNASIPKTFVDKRLTDSQAMTLV